MACYCACHSPVSSNAMCEHCEGAVMVHVTAYQRQLTERDAAIDDLMLCIGKTEIDHLQPETITLAQEVHERLWHSDPEPISGGEQT